MDLSELKPETPLSQLTAGDLMDMIGWALTHYRAAEAGDVSGFVFTGFSPTLPQINESWSSFQGRFWSRPSAGSASSQLLRR